MAVEKAFAEVMHLNTSKVDVEKAFAEVMHLNTSKATNLEDSHSMVTFTRYLASISVLVLELIQEVQFT